MTETTAEIVCIICKDGTSLRPNEIVLCDKCGIGKYWLLPYILLPILCYCISETESKVNFRNAVIFFLCACVLCGKERPSIKVHVNPPAARRRCCEGRRQVAVQRGIVETMRAQNPATSPFGFSMFKALFSESELSEAQIIQAKQEKMFIFRESDSLNYISLKVRFIVINVYSLCVSLSVKKLEENGEMMFW